MLPEFSIIVPVFNVENYLQDCLNSIQNQTYKSFEVICVNDGSTDNSVDILNSYIEKDPKFRLYSISNSGVSHARNVGLENIRGKYVLFVDADDVVERTMLSTIKQYLETDDPDILVFGGDSFPTVPWIDLKLSPRRIVYTGNGVHALVWENGSRPFACNKVYKSDLIFKENARFNEALSLGEDQAFAFYLFPIAQKISFIPNKLYHYRQGRAGSAMLKFSQNHVDKIEKHSELVAHIYRYWEGKGFLKEHSLDFINWCMIFIAKDILSLRYNLAHKLSRKLICLFDNLDFNEKELTPDFQSMLFSLRSYAKTIDKPKVSVIVPVYNSEKFIRQCIESLLIQTMAEIELIFVDDGSTDNSCAIVQEYISTDSRIQLLKQTHLYAGVARNKGIDIAKGEYLLFLDSDDYFKPDLVQIAYFYAKKYDAEICVFKALAHDMKSGKNISLPWTCNSLRYPAGKIFSRTDNLKRIFSFTTPAPWNKLFKREFVLEKQIRFQDTRSANDLAFVFTALAEATRIIAIDKELLYYRINSGNSLQQTQDLKITSFYMALRELKERLLKRNLYASLEQPYIVFALDCCLYNLSTLKNKANFIQLFNLLKDEIFQYIDVVSRSSEYFYDYTKDNYQRSRDILNLTAEEYIKKYNLFKPVNKPFKGKKIELKLDDSLLRKVLNYYSRHGMVATLKRVRLELLKKLRI